MGLNTTGFAVGLLVAQQQHLPSSSAVAIGALASVMGGSGGMGIALAAVLAQQQAQAIAAANATTTTKPSGGSGTTGTSGVSTGTPSVGWTGSSTGLLPAPPAPPVLAGPPASSAHGRAVELPGQDWLVRLGWESVDGASGYQITRFHKSKATVVASVPSHTSTHAFSDFLQKPAKPEHFTYEVATLNSAGVAGPGTPIVPTFG